MTGSLIGAAAYGVALLDHGVADTVLALRASRRVALVTPSIPAVASVSTAAQGAALGAMPRDPGIRLPARPAAGIVPLFDPAFLAVDG